MKSLKYILKTKYVLLGLLVLAAGCADLDVENTNSPTAEQVLAEPGDIESLVQSSFVSWWQGHTDEFVNGLRVGGDIYTCSWGNFNMRNSGEEPRNAYQNNPTAGDGVKQMTERLWYTMYGVHADANDFLSTVEERSLVLPSQEAGVSDEDYTSMVKAAAYMLQGVALGDIGLYFDKAFIYDETTTEQELLNLETQPYTDILAFADQKLQAAADLASGLSGVTFGDNYISGYDAMDMSTEFVELMNTMRARYMVLGARTAAENANTDWDQVKTLAANGIQSDFSPVGDNEFWFSYIYLYGNLGNWTRVDQSLICEMDPSQPCGYPTDGSDPGEATSADDRLASDFIYSGSIPYPSARGLWFYSHYISGRYDYHTFSLADGDMPYIYKAENDLMWAEAVERTSDAANYAAAAQAINNTRVGRGGLPPTQATDFGGNGAMEDIRYEREIELFSTGFMQAYGDRRRFDEMQTGTPLHYPLPAKELLILQQELYTFGGVNNAGDDGTASKLGENPFDIPVKSVDELTIPTKN